jgi:chromatin remodeling complex protein RSC6
MPKAKSTKPTEPMTSGSDVPVVDVTVVADSKTKSKVTKKATKETVPKETVSKDTVSKDTVVMTKNEVVESATETDTDTGDIALSDTFSSFLQKLQAMASHMNMLKTEFRSLEKKATRALKAAEKVNAKRKRKSGNRAPSGFVKPTLISDELATFLQKPSGTEMARTEVTREINTYIRAHNLQDKTNGRKIIPDQQLATLLKIQNGDELTYFNLQRYMSPHFAKAGQPKP